MYLGVPVNVIKNLFVAALWNTTQQDAVFISIIEPWDMRDIGSCLTYLHNEVAYEAR